MSSETYSTANFQIADTPAGHAALTRAASRLIGIPELDDEVKRHDGPDGHLLTVRDAVGRALGLDTGDTGGGFVWVERGGGFIAIGASGEGRHRGLNEVTEVLAAEGINGDVRFEDSDYNYIRVRVADGNVHEDIGEIVYSGDPVTDVWVAQMPGHGESDLDRVAVVRSEAEAEAVLLGWAGEKVAAPLLATIRSLKRAVYQPNVTSVLRLVDDRRVVDSATATDQSLTNPASLDNQHE